MEDSPFAEPERDVVGALPRAEEDEVAGPQVAFLEPLGRRLLLMGVARDEPAEPAVGHVHEAGAVDPAVGHPAPLVRPAEVAPPLGARMARTRQAGPLAVGLIAEHVLARPAGVAVGGADERPAAGALLDRERLAGERLRHLLGAVVRFRAQGRDLGCAGAELHLRRSDARV